MDYNMGAKEFLAEARDGNIDHEDFSAKFNEELKKLRIYDFFQHEQGMHGEGLPVSVKDNICVKGMQTTAGSRILQGYMPVFDASVIERIKTIGSVIGKTNQDEFGFGTFSANSAWGIPKNPLDPERSCGGSSGGAAGLTAALKMPHIALGQSTGGSISCPAAFCEVVGLTPTYGLVPRYGLIDYANSMDKIGPIAKDVWSAAWMLSIIAGYDERDSTSLDVPRKDYTKTKGIKGMKLAVPKEYFINVDKSVEKDTWAAIKKLESLGATYEEVSLPNTQNALYAYYIIAACEASTNLARFCGMRYGMEEDIKGNFNEYFSSVRTKGFGEEAKRRIMLGTFARMSGYREAYYHKAMRVRTLVINEFKSIFGKYDAIAAPTMPIRPPKFTDIKKLKPMEVYQMDILTVPANLAGIPTISVPCGKMTGLHVVGNHLEEEKIISIASAYEGAR
ncbi:MAG: Asp-tRNA(Asn)/Glu-tRNA(Gln) amidotransferase subunit GatA [Candidatus Aenigmarchaeota archaeon]|nr:Asp-tRNA(Asn)/Glu-tRNA(Gln) amidotransferase subunit GatA [Candidatus Aenigmarchaeota archaeon]